MGNAASLTAEQMQAVAREIGAPATGFVQRATASSVDVRFFSTQTEYGMCGHGTLGLMTWLVERGKPCLHLPPPFWLSLSLSLSLWLWRWLRL